MEAQKLVNDCTSLRKNNLYKQLQFHCLNEEFIVSRRTDFNIGTNDTFEECTLFGYLGEEDIIQILHHCMLLAKYLIYIH